MNGNVIRTITIRGTSEGLDKLQTDLVKVAAAHKDVAIAAEQTDKKTLSLEQTWKRQTLRLDEAARAQNNIARETKTAKQMLDEQRITTEQYAERLNLINQHYTKASQGAQTYGKALQQGTGEARLARHELINLSRQIQDVGVSLASGQAPLTVLVQQGSQIADVFATSAGTIRGFFSQAAVGAGRFLSSATGIVSSIAAIGVGLVAAGSRYASGQREIQKGLSGIGAASGVTRDQINQIAEASSSWAGQSVSQAREAATAFAATGKIQAENVGLATKVIDNYVRAGGDATEMTKTLAAAMQDPAKAALELNKSYGFLSVAMLENIRNLQAQGKEQAAAKALLEGLNPAIQKQAENVGAWTQMWNVATNVISAATDAVGKFIARQAERATGANLGGFSDEERLGRARERVSSLQERIAQPRSAMQAAVPQSAMDEWLKQLKEAQEEVARLEKALDTAGAAFRKLGTDALAFADSFLPLQAQIRETEQGLAKLREAEAAGAYVNPAAIQAGEIRLQQLRDQEAAIFRQNQYTQQIAAQYPGMSAQVALQLSAQKDQLAVAQAGAGAEQRAAQETATRNMYLAQGKTLQEAQALAAGQRAIAEAEAARRYQIMLVAAQGALAVAQARTGAEKIVAQEEATINNLMMQGLSHAQALTIAALNRAAAEANATNAVLQQVDALKDQIALSKARMAGREAVVKAEIAAKNALESGASASAASALKQATLDNERQQALERTGKSIQSNTDYTREWGGAVGDLAREFSIVELVVGRLSLMIQQFEEGKQYQLGALDLDKAQYHFFDAWLNTLGRSDLIEKNVERERAAKDVSELNATRLVTSETMLKAAGLTTEQFVGQQNISSPAAIQQSFMNVIGLGFEQGLAPITRLIDAVADPAQQISLIQQTIGYIQAREQPGLASEEMINTLNDKLEQLSKSTDSLNETIQNALSPFYSQDPRTTKLGFRAGAVGNPDWMTGATNANPLIAILGAGATAPGMANGGSFIVGGGYSANDNAMAMFPVASGEQVMVNRTPQSRGGQVINIDNRIVISGSVDAETLNKLKVSKFQQAQRMRNQLAQA